jgi:hypothetical protein
MSAVLLRTGLAHRDDVGEMVAVARALRPGTPWRTRQPGLGHRSPLVPLQESRLPRVPAGERLPPADRTGQLGEGHLATAATGQP